jgi:hypothetical protein
VLDEVAKKTPRNYLRKRLLAEAATLNGDAETARAAMADVIANDTMPGAIAAEGQAGHWRAAMSTPTTRYPAEKCWSACAKTKSRT